MDKSKMHVIERAVRAQSIPGLTFDMNRYGEVAECGACGCIAGHVVAKYKPETWQRFLKGKITGDKIHTEAREILGLSVLESLSLFTPWRVDLQMVTAKIAADVMAKFRHRGEVTWPKKVMYGL